MERFTRLLQERTTRIEQRIAAALEPVGMSAGEGARAPGPVITIGEWIAALSDDLASKKMPGTHDAARQLGLREAKRFFQRDIPASQFMSASEQVRRACLDLAAEGGLSSSEDGVTSGLWAFFARLKSSFFEESQRLWAKDAGTMTPPAAPDGALPQGAAVAVGAAFPLDADLMTAALQAAGNAVVITDGEGTIRWVNSAFTRLTQYSDDEAIGKNTRILKSGAQDEAVYRTLWTTITAGGVWKGELVNKRKDGTLYTEEMTITPVRHGDGMVDHFIAVKEDISLRKATEAALKASEEHYRLLVENQGEGIGIVDMEEKFIFCNPAAEVIFGVQPGGLLERKVTEFLDSSQAEVVRRQSAVRRKGEKSTYELNIVPGDGGRRNLLVTAVPRTDAEGKAGGTFGVFRDITHRKRAEEMLREAEARYRAIFQANADGILIADIGTKAIKYANPALCEMLGYTESELTMLSPADIHPLEDLRWIMPQFEAQSRGEKKTASDIPCLRKDGTKFYADINAACIEISGRPHLVGLFRDVTERKRNEDHAQGHLEELRRWQAVMLDREDRIQELKREVNDLSRSKGKSPPYPSQETAPDPVGRVS